MASLGAYILAGSAKSLGDNMLNEAKQLREERLKQLDYDREDQRDATQRAFQSGEAEKGRAFSAKQTQEERDWQLKNGGESLTLEDGTLGTKRGDTITQAKGPDGKPVKALSKNSQDKPAEVATAEWLVSKGVAKDANEAWRLVRLQKQDPEKSRASIYKGWMDTLTKGSMGNVDGAKIQEEAQKRTEETMRYLDSMEEGPTSTSEPAKPDKAADYNKRGEIGIASAPANVADRKVGTKYRSSSGKIGTWTAQGWKVE